MSHGAYAFVTVMDFDPYTSIEGVSDLMVVRSGKSLRQNLDEAVGFNDHTHTNLRLCVHGTRSGDLKWAAYGITIKQPKMIGAVLRTSSTILSS